MEELGLKGGRTRRPGGEGGDRDLEFAVSRRDKMSEQLTKTCVMGQKGA